MPLLTSLPWETLRAQPSVVLLSKQVSPVSSISAWAQAQQFWVSMPFLQPFSMEPWEALSALLSAPLALERPFLQSQVLSEPLLSGLILTSTIGPHSVAQVWPARVGPSG